MEKSRLQLNQLCQSFQLLFQKLKDNRSHKLEIEKSNDQLQQLIEVERLKRLQNESILEQEKDQLEKQLKQVQEILEAYQASNNQIIQAINVSATQHKVLLEEKQNLEDNLKDKEGSIHDKIQQQSFLKEEMNILCRSMNLINGSEKDLENAVLQSLTSLDQQKSKLNEMLQKIKEADDNQALLAQERDKAEANYKAVQRELAQTIKQNALVQQKIKDCSKVFEKLSQQLNSKMERLNTQYKHNDQLNQQVKKLENIKTSQQMQQNQQFEKSNQSQITKNLSPQSRMKVSKQKQAMQNEQQLTDESKLRINDYKLQLSQQLDYYKSQIEQFDSMINQLQTDIDNLQSQFEQYTFIPQDQLIQLFQQHFLTQNTNEDQEFYPEQDANHLQQANYETFSQRNENGAVEEDENMARNLQINSQQTNQQNNFSDGIFQQEDDEVI